MLHCRLLKNNKILSKKLKHDLCLDIVDLVPVLQSNSASQKITYPQSQYRTNFRDRRAFRDLIEL